MEAVVTVSPRGICSGAWPLLALAQSNRMEERCSRQPSVEVVVDITFWCSERSNSRRFVEGGFR